MTPENEEIKSDVTQEVKPVDVESTPVEKIPGRRQPKKSPPKPKIAKEAVRPVRKMEFGKPYGTIRHAEDMANRILGVK